MKLLIVVPAFNEAPVIVQTIKEIQIATSSLPHTYILVIDDCSRDNTYQLAQSTKVQVLRHVINRGLGGALGTGLAYARKHDFDYLITIDADGQHDPQDIHKLLLPLTKNRADVVIGSRTISTKGKIPLDRVILNYLSNLFTRIMYGVYSTDSQSGFRAFNRQAIHHITIKTQRMEVSSEIFSDIKTHQLRLAERPIKVIYTDYSRAKGQPNSNAISIIIKSILRLFR